MFLSGGWRLERETDGFEWVFGFVQSDRRLLRRFTWEHHLVKSKLTLTMPGGPTTISQQSGKNARKKRVSMLDASTKTETWRSCEGIFNVNFAH